MEISKAAVGILVGACVTAGAGGAYLANRDNARVAASAQEQAPAPFESGATVEHSEAIVAESPAPEPAPPPAPVARRTAEEARTPAVDTRRPQTTVRADREPAPPARIERTVSPAPPPPVIEDEAPLPAPIEPPRLTDNRPALTVEPPGPLYDELVVAADSVIGLEIEGSVTSERARVEDPVLARVTRDVRVGDRVAIPAGSRAHGEVTLVEPGGRLRDRARLGVRFTSIVLADGTHLPIDSETIYREGDAPGNESAAKIGGGAIGGAIIGGILGGAKGAAIGSAVGAGGGTAAVLAGGRNAATLPSGTPVTVRIEEPVIVTVER